MKTASKFLSFFAASCLALASSAFGQLVTYETQSTYQGSTFTFSGPLGQTFTNVSAVASMTYNFFSGSGSSTATSLTATFGQWTGSAFVGGTTVDFGTINIPASGGLGWTTLVNATPGSPYSTYEYQFDLTSLSATYPSMINENFGYLTSAANTYALMLSPVSGSGLGLGFTNTDAFAYGATNVGFNDWSFAQIVIAPGDQIIAVPEAGTVASIVGGIFIAGLVGLRMRQRRQMALVENAV